MKVERKGASAISGKWAKPVEHIMDQDVITFLDEGQVDESGVYGKKVVFKVKVPRQTEELNLSMNQSSINNLVEAYGEETSDWVGKRAKAYLVKQMVGDGMKTVMYFVGSGFALDEDFKLVKTTPAPAAPARPVATKASASDDNIPTINSNRSDDDIRLEDIPF